MTPNIEGRPLGLLSLYPAPQSVSLLPGVVPEYMVIKALAQLNYSASYQKLYYFIFKVKVVGLRAPHPRLLFLREKSNQKHAKEGSALFRIS